MMSILKTIVCTIATVVTTVIVILFVVRIADSVNNTDVPVISERTIEQTTKQTDAAKSNGYIIYENEYIRATYLGIGNSFGYVTLDIKFENKTDGEITVVPLDSSVDNTMVQFLSGVPATMQGHKSMNQAWLIGNEPQDNIEFKFGILDENWSELAVTDVIRIEK
nr:MAG TPA: hypothetical protein [Caudoviricetes sp.]